MMSQFGIITDLNLIRDHETEKSKGFGFVSFMDWRSTVLAVDNMNGADFMGRKLKVDHVLDYRPADKERGPSWWEQKQKQERKKRRKDKKEKKHKKKEKKEKKERKKAREEEEKDDKEKKELHGGLLVKGESSKKRLIQMNDGSVYIKDEK